jgi:hypothetical protein
MLSISSPFAKEGQFYDTYSKHHGDDDSAVLSWQAASMTMNPTLPQEVVDQAYADDFEATLAEYGAQFRSDIASFVDRDVVMGCIENGTTQRGFRAGERYFAFCDPSGGSKDSFTCCISHRENDDAVLDRLLEIKAPFNPGAAVGDIVAMLKEFGLTQVIGDKYAAQWVIAEFEKRGVKYQHSIRDRSAVYLSALPLINSGKAKLLDSPRLVNQLVSLQRRTGSSGKQSVDHPRNGADDLANAAMGAIVLASDMAAIHSFVPPIVWTREGTYGSGNCGSFDGPVNIRGRFPDDRHAHQRHDHDPDRNNPSVISAQQIARDPRTEIVVCGARSTAGGE